MRCLAAFRISFSVSWGHSLLHTVVLAPHLPSTFVLAAHWNYLLTKVADLETGESDELLGEIVDKWVKIRSHSFASGWVEQYQIAIKQIY